MKVMIKIEIERLLVMENEVRKQKIYKEKTDKFKREEIKEKVLKLCSAFYIIKNSDLGDINGLLLDRLFLMVRVHYAMLRIFMYVVGDKK